MQGKQLKVSSAALLLLAGVSMWSSAALADCALSLSNPDLDFGVLKRDSLQLNAGQVTLGERSMSLTLSCDSAQDLTLFYRGAALDPERFQFGSRGHYQVRIRDAVLDGASVSLGELGRLGEAPTQADNNLVWRPDRAVVPMAAGSVVQGKVLQAQLDFVALAPREAIRVRDETRWQAAATIDMPAGGTNRELTLNSSIMPVSCEPTLSGGGRVDFGKHSVSQLNRNAETSLAPRTVELSILCDGPAMIAVSTLDNRDGSATGGADDEFGLGLGAGKRLGKYSVELQNINVDGWGTAYATRSQDAGLTWSAAQSAPGNLSKSAWVGFSQTSGAATGPADLTQMSATLVVTPTIAPIVELDVSGLVELDGSATLEIRYL